MAKSSKPVKSRPSKGWFSALKKAFDRVKPALKGRNILLLVITGILFGFLPFFQPAKKAEADIELVADEQTLTELINGLPLLQDNSFLPVSSPLDNEEVVVRKMKVVVTAYSSSPWQTDDTPFVTASGTGVREGVVANNLLPFGTKIRMPELYGSQIFVVEDRMKRDRSKYQFDVWLPSYREAKNFGAKATYVEVLGS